MTIAIILIIAIPLMLACEFGTRPATKQPEDQHAVR
jgi:hypothetical protein